MTFLNDVGVIVYYTKEVRILQHDRGSTFVDRIEQPTTIALPVTNRYFTEID